MGSLRQVLGGLLLCLSVSVAARDNAGRCVTRRCLASQLINQTILSQPQSPSCDLNVTVMYLTYQTIEVDTKLMHFSSQLTLKLKWKDPDLSWNETVYNFTLLVLPANKIWTPSLTVDNAVAVKTDPITSDVVVDSSGTVEYSINMYTTVKCAINLFTYPIVHDHCPVALNGWTNKEGCGMHLHFNSVDWKSGSTAEWITQSVSLEGPAFRNYLYVEMSVSIFNPVVGLLMPSILIILADIMSCMLPLGGGERNGFKVTLVLSFTMFLVLLTQQLPDSRTCSPLIRYHFLVSLLLLVMSMLASLVLTRIAAGCTFISCGHGEVCQGKQENPQKKGNGVISDETLDNVAPMKRMAEILEAKQQKKLEDYKSKAFAEKLDRIGFVIYITLGVIYVCCMVAIAKQDFCSENNLDFWTDW